MAKAVFRPTEVQISNKPVVLDVPQGMGSTYQTKQEEEVQNLEDFESYQGPTADDLRREAEAFKAQWEQEREAMINAAKAEAEAIIKDAEAAAFQEVKRKTDQAQQIRRQAEDEAERIIAEAQRKAQEIERAAQQAFEKERKEAEAAGFAAGREAGYAEGRAEVQRLIERAHQILERAQEKRAEILAETEQQIVDLVLLIARKVIKVISENQRNVVVSNVVQALRKVKGRGDIIIRVNVDDLKLTTEHIKDFIQLIEGVKNIQVVEDSSVDRGGCIIDTDFGEIDARISSQLAELEQKILEISPIRAKARTAPLDER
ncbi:MAG TPA: flagellar assembly protein FliH [Treponema sp.]|jgi:flagellar assembly protein FliH|uniref:flagellar assembly protein FliH n=1 Tax=Gracilinema caldarium TaxID=215591 RepID=UPI0016B98369|nr:flagellar assembly protein FliH [Gracilinema caldarium]NLJ09987.1 flagellar assembly protein FliH [Treponema sp.]HON12548.1 flagellar assembly protein FliH [Treponema sp.]HPC70278.1 flagellar assembly protein FliH [Treponema sp.]HRS02920.1 flagellar assembly protein FliH [Treponema sp.]HRU27493.1 flagellar assembly protein FliH [Treponema sp.]